MNPRAKEIVGIGNKLFSSKKQVDDLWQEIALNFYPERADFTDIRSEGDELSDHLFSSYPVLARRELGNILSSNLRPQSQKWFSVHVDDITTDEESAERRFLEFLTEIQWRGMYDPAANFVRATKEGDHDYAAFGNAVIQISKNIRGDGLLYRTHHLRDCAWTENYEGKVDHIHRNWVATARQLEQAFPATVSSEIKKAVTKDPEKQFKCRHVILPTSVYGYKNKFGTQFPFVSLYIETESEKVLEEVGLAQFRYVIPRWMTVSGSQYGRSMATAVALPDSRTTQIVTRTLREAGEKFVDPPMIAIAEAIRGDIPLYPGGITYADMEYDERLGEVLRPLSQDKSGMPIGMDIAQALREDIRHSFFLDKIQLPETTTEMTAYEVRRRIEEQIRAVSPLFEPVEQEYNYGLCDLTFEMMTEGNAFPMEHMPKSLSGRDVRFTFRSPLADMAQQSEAATFVDVMQRIIMPVAQIDPSQIENVDITKATREAMRAAGWKADWFKPEELVAQKREELQKKQQMAEGMAMAQQAGAAGEQVGKAGQAMKEIDMEGIDQQ